MKRGDQPVNPLPSDAWKKHPEMCGLTVRERFAAAALTGLLANPMNTRERLSFMAGLAWQAADEMLEERFADPEGRRRG